MVRSAAMELAQAIRAIEPKLAPFVLVISNDPDEDPDLTKVDVADDAVLADISVPIAAVANTRTSRGRLAVGQLESAMDSLAPDAIVVAAPPMFAYGRDFSRTPTANLKMSPALFR